MIRGYEKYLGNQAEKIRPLCFREDKVSSNRKIVFVWGENKFKVLSDCTISNPEIS